MNKPTKTNLTKGENFQKSAKCEYNQSSPMSTFSWCDLNSNNKKLRLHDYCPNLNCKGQNQIIFTTNQFQLEGASFKYKLQ